MHAATESSPRHIPVPRCLLVVLTAAQAMTFLEHLDELRTRIFWSIAAVAAAFAICWAFAGEL